MADWATISSLATAGNIPAGDIGLWQGALRDSSDAQQAELAGAIEQRQPISVELLYTDQVGGQRTISRFNLIPMAHEDQPEEVKWPASAVRHWYLDGAGPR